MYPLPVERSRLGVQSMFVLYSAFVVVYPAVPLAGILPHVIGSPEAYAIELYPLE